MVAAPTAILAFVITFLVVVTAVMVYFTLVVSTEQDLEAETKAGEAASGSAE